MTTRIVESGRDRDKLARFLENQKPPFTVTITKGKQRSVEQNRLQRLWVAEIAEQLGDRTAEEVRGYCKLHIGVPILRAENEAFALAYDQIIKPLPYEHKLRMMMVPLDWPVTRHMTTKQKHLYLERVYQYFSEQGLELTDPSPLLGKRVVKARRAA